MAVGYHKLNSSAARSKNRAGNRCNDSPRPVVVAAGASFNHPMFGLVKTMSDFVSDRDVVECISTQGKLILSGGFIREWIRLSPA